MITEREIGGIPALLAPATGPMHAGLVFRVGHADEPLAKRGITHLIEHLALFSFGVADYHYNGATGVEYTYFHMQGAEADIVTFLNGVCAGLRELPMSRLPVEKEILRTEENGRGESPAGPLGLWRHGARDYGMPAFPEWGLTGLTPDDLRDWVARWFTAENAALWIAGPGVPDGLDLRLPHGERRPAPAPSNALPCRPAYFAGPENVVAWNAAVPRQPAAAVLAGVLERALFRSLRQESGLSYTVQADFESRGDGAMVITAAADALPEKQEAVLRGFVEVLEVARDGGFAPAEITAVVNQRCEDLARAEEAGARLPAQVFNLLAGRRVRQLDEALAELREVTPADVAVAGRLAVADGLLMTPGRTTAEWAGYTAAPECSTEAVTGAEYRLLDPERPGDRLIAGTHGISLVGDASTVTVRYDGLAGVLSWPDGARRFIGHDGIQVHVEPTLVDGGPALVAALDTGVRPEQRVTMAARDPARIPHPPAPPAPPPRDPRRTERIWRLSFAAVGLIGLVTLRLLAPPVAAAFFAIALIVVFAVYRILGR
ncbi:peptidase [Actinoplanes sp. SE50]|uniref:M16 family metallopeptidase n=1 Tax=unclassified Actinoplanes TaxID=2626549 RepID=UPI00023EBC9E|nr:MULTISPECIES: insulinase family protein [unclassified Actinoplanes]AEV81761.1 putative zinc protease [Actinoplanes sp. SE50/110]ATO80162.1 peptidase [Actinoplanes sp. SE50]SLL97566.1 peptidase [Actinoplanes sp. SE50/110]